MIDLHCHLLPGIDDGPDTLEAALKLCRIAVEDGITHAVVTPHIHPGRWENNRESIQRKFQSLKVIVEHKGIPLRLGFAGEVRLSDQIMQQVGGSEIPFYGMVDGFRIMLLEFPHGHIIPGSVNLVEWLVRHKIRPLIAHPERNRQVMKDPAQLEPFINAGCWLQLTAGSVNGDFGSRAKKIARLLLQEDLVTVVASDGHNSRSRLPVLGKAYVSIAGEYGVERAVRLMQATPAHIVAGQFKHQDLAV